VTVLVVSVGTVRCNLVRGVRMMGDPQTAAMAGSDGKMSRLLQAWLLTGVIDGAFSGTLSAVFYGSTAARLFQGVAATVLGAAAFDGGSRTAAIGVALHFGVALAWSVVFLVVSSRSAFVQQVVASPGGAFKVAAAFGPLIWMVMSLVVIPVLLQRPPSITIRWWIQFFGHIPFVALPIVMMIARRIPPWR
jgi:hypothetical protein